MSRLKLLSTLLLVALLLPVCSRRELVDEASELSVEIEINPSPPKLGPAILIIRIFGENGADPGAFSLDIRADMSHAGMKPVLVDAASGQDGNYTVPFEWTMAGDWILSISASLPDGRILRRTHSVRVEP
jgi:hypothetical protein